MKFVSGIIFVCVLSFSVYAQESTEVFEPSGKPFATVFFDYHYDLTKNALKPSKFEVKRSYLGYKYSFSEKWSTKITLDVGYNSSGSELTAYLKHAELDYKVFSFFTLNMGVIGFKAFNDQEHFWGYRYLFKSAMDEYGFSSSAQIGLNAEIKPVDWMKINLFVVNGEGYKKVQDNYGKQELGANIVVSPLNGLIIKGYYHYNPFKALNKEMIAVDTSSISVMAFFVGYKLERFRIGAEYNVQNNGITCDIVAANHDISLLSFYGTFILNGKMEIFARYDRISSNTLAGDAKPWNETQNGSIIISGFQYSPIKGVKLALNYRTRAYNTSKINSTNGLLVNFEYKF